VLRKKESDLKRPFDRRQFLRGAGISLTLPMFESLSRPAFATLSDAGRAQRFVCMAPDYGIYPGGFFPTEPGSNYAMPPVLQSMERHRHELSLFSHLDHPGVGGGHACSRTLLNGVMANHINGERRRLLSLDQVIGEQIGAQTRFPALVTGNGVPISYTRAGIPVPSVPDPERFFHLLFVEDSADVKSQQRQALDDNASILDVLLEDSKSLQRKLAVQDRTKLEEYLTAVRETERKLLRRKDWLDIAKPKVKAPQTDEDAEEVETTYPYDMALYFEIMVLALQSDSTRVITYQMPGGNRLFPFDGITWGYHSLTHHGKDPDKARQLQIIDSYYLTQLAGFIDRLKTTRDREGRSLLDTTIVLFGSGMGNAGSHSSRDLPILIAGGGLKHGSHHSFPKDGKQGTPLSNLYVTLLQQLGMETDQFSTSNGNLNHLLV